MRLQNHKCPEIHSTTAENHSRNGLSKMKNQELIHLQQSKILTFKKKNLTKTHLKERKRQAPASVPVSSKATTV